MSLTTYTRVSVIIPCYNSARFVHRALETALNQTYKDVEVILVDDCSTDDLEQAVKNFSGRVILCRHLMNLGPSKSRNTGVEHATGDVLAFLDADDWWPDDLLEQLMPHVSAGHAVCYDNYIVPEDETDHAIEVAITDTLLSEWLKRGPKELTCDSMDKIISIPSLFKIIVNRQDYDKVQGFDTRFFGIEDFHFYVKLLASGVNISVISEPKGYYLIQQNSILRTIKRDSGKQIKTLKRWWQMFRVMPEELALSEQAAKQCRVRSRYYRARYVDAVVKQCVKEKDYRSLISTTSAQEITAALPGILSFKMQGLARKLQHKAIVEN